MSYSTRRSGGFAGQQQQNVANIGQRRPVVTNNFVPGGQNKPAGQQQQVRAQQPQQQNTSIQFRNQQASQQAQQKQQAAQATQQQAAQATQQQQAQQLQQQTQQLQQQQLKQQQVKMEAPQTPNKPFVPAVPAAPVEENPEVENANGEEMDTTGEVKKKPFWVRGNKGKISKKEKARRRNLTLSKILQPKNAVMILNELVKNTSYTVDELPMKVDGNTFRATVLYEGSEHVGFGRSKIQAKNSAAETALKHFVKTHKLGELNKDEEGNEKMDVSEEDTQNPLPWQHVVSFALFKLFCSWGEDPNLVKSQTQPGVPENHENKPAKKMPPNPETINPLMLVNQMLPQAQFEEIGKSGNPPNVIFSFRCNVNDQSFVGTGPNKKAAKRLAAFGACHKVLGVNYPSDVYVPIF
ncbi:hypothetical protein JTB14_000508 [Gonioctena quinquepunctata]|nr:hypothetical protein JTB14_000508 [Gonioctena quinquepunctata]